MARILWKEESKAGPALIHVLQASDSPNPANEQNGRFPHTHQVPGPEYHLSVAFLSKDKMGWNSQERAH